MHFSDRAEAGRFLAAKLARLAGRRDLLVLALPRGGVPVGYKVARALGAPFDVFVVRKLGVPGHRELAMGAIASGGIRVFNPAVVSHLGARAEQAIEQVTREESQGLEKRETRYRDGRPFPDLGGRTVVLVDDGLATGATMRAAVAAVRLRQPASVIVAVPIAAEESCDRLRSEADEVICAVTPEPFYGVGQFYDDFRQITDEEVRSYLAATKSEETH